MVVHRDDALGVLLDVGPERPLDAVPGDEDRVVARSSSHHLSKIFRDIPFWSIPGPAITTQGVAVLMSNSFSEKKWGELERVRGRALHAVVHALDAALVDVEVLVRHAAAEPQRDLRELRGCCVQYSSMLSMSSCARPSANMGGIRYFPPPLCRCSSARPSEKSFSRFSRGSWLLIPYVDSMMSTSTPGDGGRLGAHEVVVLLPGEVPRVQHALPVDVYKEHTRAEDVPRVQTRDLDPLVLDGLVEPDDLDALVGLRDVALLVELAPVGPGLVPGRG